MDRPYANIELPELVDYWQERGINVPRYLSDEQTEELAFISDYRANGDLKCVVCNGTGRYVYMGQEYECPDDAFGHVIMRLARLYWLSNIKLQHQKLVWSEWPTATSHQIEAKNFAENYIDKFDFLRLNGVGATIIGKTLGGGKTWLATAILKELVKQGVRGWFVPFYEMKSYFQMDNGPTKRFLTEKIHSSSLLVLDEVQLGWTNPMRSLFQERLEELIRPRTDSNLPTIITSNLTEAELEKEYPRVHSLLSAKNMIIELNGEDARLGKTIWDRQVEAPLNGEALPVD